MYVKCPYRSRCGTGTGVLGVFLLVWVPSMDLYEHWFIGVQARLEHCFIDSAGQIHWNRQNLLNHEDSLISLNGNAVFHHSGSYYC